jgi:hypothetical protein
MEILARCRQLKTLILKDCNAQHLNQAIEASSTLEERFMLPHVQRLLIEKRKEGRVSATSLPKLCPQLKELFYLSGETDACQKAAILLENIRHVDQVETLCMPSSDPFFEQSFPLRNFVHLKKLVWFNCGAFENFVPLRRLERFNGGA